MHWDTTSFCSVQQSGVKIPFQPMHFLTKISYKKNIFNRLKSRGEGGNLAELPSSATMPLTTPTTSTTVTALYDDVSPRLFLNLNQNETKVDGLGSQQSVALRRLGQRQGIVLRLGRLRAELKLINGRQHRSIAKWAG